VPAGHRSVLRASDDQRRLQDPVEPGSAVEGSHRPVRHEHLLLSIRRQQTPEQVYLGWRHGGATE
jgi:hypothetical protein